MIRNYIYPLLIEYNGTYPPLLMVAVCKSLPCTQMPWSFEARPSYKGLNQLLLWDKVCPSQEDPTGSCSGISLVRMAAVVGQRLALGKPKRLEILTAQRGSSVSHKISVLHICHDTEGRPRAGAVWQMAWKNLECTFQLYDFLVLAGEKCLRRLLAGKRNHVQERNTFYFSERN